MATREPGPDGASARDVTDSARDSLDQTFDVDALYMLRSALIAHGSELGAREAEVDRLVLVASELATNAVRHGGGTGRLRLWRSSDQLVCEVSDKGAGISNPDIGAGPVEPTAMGGRGLWICRALSDTITIAAGRPGAIVTVTIAIDQA
jgi:anti-sigma regulatory factor (Ser/Thr protein kinase)